jgi:hypothetical protein
MAGSAMITPNASSATMQNATDVRTNVQRGERWLAMTGISLTGFGRRHRAVPRHRPFTYPTGERPRKRQPIACLH